MEMSTAQNSPDTPEKEEPGALPHRKILNKNYNN